MTNIKKNVIIVAGGKGQRMGADLPKQFIPINGMPILMRTIKAFYDFDNKIQIILVIPISHQIYWLDLCEEYNFEIKHRLAKGGDTRFHSVQNGLELVEEGIAAVHDGVRPFVSQEMIKKCFKDAKTHQAVIPVVDSVDSMRQLDANGKSKIIDRSAIKLVQTPQVFDVELLKKAYKVEYNKSFTDDASVVEAMGTEIYLTQGEMTNIKVTTPFDLKVGELLCKDN